MILRSTLVRSSVKARTWAFAVVLGLATVVTGFGPGAPAYASEIGSAPDTMATELVRLLNGERTTHGLPALAVDPFLATKARDGAVDCPDGSGTMEGRAKDMALTGYFAHSLRLCPAAGILDAMRAWGYRSYAGEILAMNSGGASSDSYQFGCDIGRSNCTGATTSAPASVAEAARQFMSSQGHRDIVLSRSYDRFACGSWASSTSGYPYYACLFSFGPRTASVPAPTATPVAPRISARSPAAGRVGVDRDASVRITFSVPVAGVSRSTVYLVRTATGTRIAATVRVSGRVVTIDPTWRLRPWARFRVIVTSGLRAVDGGLHFSGTSWLFRTGGT